MEIINRMQIVNPEKLAELCRMHLTFTLDLHDEEFSALLNVKNDAKNKWSYFRKAKDRLSEMPLTQGSISQIYQIIEYLGRDINLDHEGLFRKTGSLSRQQELKALLNAGATIDFSLGHYSIDDCASVMKNFLSSLSEPLLTEAHYSAHCQISDMMVENISPELHSHLFQRQLKSTRLLLLLLPQENYSLLKYLLLLLSQVQSAQKKNLMTIFNLATIFAPHILCPRKMTPDQVKTNFPSMVKSVSFLIENATALFNPPEELVQDVTYYLDKLPLPANFEMMETEAVKTAVAFCERTNMDDVNSEDYTKKALTELHSYIQHLPNSARKRKLIKKLQTENGNNETGENKRKHVRSRSVGDAIKRHLWKGGSRHKEEFHKNYHHASYDMLTSASSSSHSSRVDPTKAKSVEALNLEKVSSTSKHGVMTKNWLRASKKLKSLQF